MTPRVPRYFDFLIDAFLRGAAGRYVHLGHWDHPPALGMPPRPGEFEAAQDRLNSILLGMADLYDGQRVLDVGCGFGGTLDRINLEHRNVTLAGLNIDIRQLSLCRQVVPLNQNRLHWIGADACLLPFAPAGFDRVLSVEALFHFPSRQSFLAEAARVLRPGGILVLSDILLDEAPIDPELPNARIASILDDGYGPWPNPWIDEAKLRQLARSAGLRCAQSIDATLNTLPSHRFTAPADGDRGRDPGSLLKWLHEAGRVRYVYIRFEKGA